MQSDSRPLYTLLAGQALLEAPILNKGSAFSLEERNHFNLNGLLPDAVESIDEQVERAYTQYSQFSKNLDKHIYLRNIQDTNETLFYRLLNQHLEEMMSIVYTPTVGDACQEFSRIYRRGRGLFVSYSQRENMYDILNNASRFKVKVIVVTDGERILGLGDQGIGGMGIPVGKLSLYTACAGISPAHTLPVVLDVGTNNDDLLNDPMYMGARHRRINDDEYIHFVDQFMSSVQELWPDALVQFEDFAQHNATKILDRYRQQARCFNDDIQGTAATTVGSLIAACAHKNETLLSQKIGIVGSGSAGCGIAEAIIAQIMKEGVGRSQAQECVYMVDRDGLLHTEMDGLRPFQQRLCRPREELDRLIGEGKSMDLHTLIDTIKPTVLIGVSGVQGLFSESIIRSMSEHCPRPVIFPLSNPTAFAEARPCDILAWTHGTAIIATGSPFDPVEFDGQTVTVSQCNNSYIFPGLGLGIIASGAARVSDEMLQECSRVLAEASPLLVEPEPGETKGQVDEGKAAGQPLLPPLSDIQALSKSIALAVGMSACKMGLATPMSEEQLKARIEAVFWSPEYRRYKRSAK
ncbi:NAD-dependent malic enzyme [Pseudoteredinibacter isoporae]|uniref:NAD-dependent malic enzyme n=1 Tax=Pseudoteredinibacter isoporae TaxID=570281 RepID=UPI00310A03D5